MRATLLRFPRRVWWAPVALATLSIVHLLAGRRSYGGELSATALIVAAAIGLGHAVGTHRPRWVSYLVRATVAILTILLLIGTLSTVTYAYTWNKQDMDGYFFAPSVRASIDTLFRSEQLIENEGTRSWVAPRNARSATLRIVGHAVPSRGTAAWDASPGATTTMDGHTAVLDVGGSPDYAFLAIPTGAPVRERRFHVRMDVMADAEAADEWTQEASIWMMTWEGPTLSSQGRSFVVEPDAWGTLHHEWQVPRTAEATVLRLLFRSDHPVRVRNVEVTEVMDEERFPLTVVQVSIDGKRAFEEAIVPAGGEALYGKNILFPRTTSSNGDRIVSARLYAGPGHSFKVEESELLINGGTPASPHPWKFHRQRFWFAHPTLAGHVVTVIVVAVLAMSHGRAGTGTRAALLMLGVANVWLTESDIAFGVLLLGGTLLMTPMRFPRRRRGAAVTMLVLALTGSGLLAFGTSDRWRTDLANRLETWNPFLDCVSPMSLWIPTSCPALEAGHAHNFVLQSLASGGVTELVLVCTALGALAAASPHRQPYLVLFLCVLVLQLLDYTLLHVGVLAPLSLAAGVFVAAEEQNQRTGRIQPTASSPNRGRK